MSTSKTLRIAGLQVASKVSFAEGNLANAEKYVSAAVEQGAEFVVGPELLTPGYIFHSSIWNSAEPRGGITDGWLSRLARKYRIYLGVGYLEAEGSDFFDTFALMGPDGAEVGRVRKAYAPNWEGFYYKQGDLDHVIETPFGRIGVSICFENYFSTFLKLHSQNRVSLVLMPSCAASNDPPSRLLFWNNKIGEVSAFYSSRLGVPSIMVNKVGQYKTPMPLIPFYNLPMKFDGSSAISNADGQVLAQLGTDEEGVVISDVELDSKPVGGVGDIDHIPSTGFAMPTSMKHRIVYAPLDVLRWVGRVSYRTSGSRKKAAKGLVTESANASSVGSSVAIAKDV